MKEKIVSLCDDYNSEKFHIKNNSQLRNSVSKLLPCLLHGIAAIVLINKHFSIFDSGK